VTRLFFALVIVSTLTTSCGSTTGMTQPTPAACPSSSPLAPVGLPTLVYPSDGATNVSITFGTLIFQALSAYSATSFALGASGAATVKVSATAVPSPLPSGVPAGTPYFALSVPPLSPSTNYRVTYSYTVESQDPSCVTHSTVTLGSFTTGP
jgi:hypothetical protein